MIINSNDECFPSIINIIVGANFWLNRDMPISTCRLRQWVVADLYLPLNLCSTIPVSFEVVVIFLDVLHYKCR